MYDDTVRHRALALPAQGATISETSRTLGVSRYAVREWHLRGGRRASPSTPCPRCSDPPGPPQTAGAYSYLLGLYLGDARSQFSNVSTDIRQFFTDALDRLGVAWRQMNRKNISVARAEGVARLDEFVGPKH